jgi:hypothetical protein
MIFSSKILIVLMMGMGVGIQVKLLPGDFTPAGRLGEYGRWHRVAWVLRFAQDDKSLTMTKRL